MLAKLRLYTESTLCLLESSTSSLGHMLRQFKATMCNAFDTHELPSEEALAVRGHQKAAAATKRPGTTSEQVKVPAKMTQNGWH